MAYTDGRKCSSEWSTNTTQCSGWTCYKGRDGQAIMDYALWLFLNGVYEPMDLDIDVGKDNEIFSSH